MSVWVCVCVRLASIQRFDCCKIAKGTLDILLKRNEKRTYIHTQTHKHNIPFHWIGAIATITITVNRLVCCLLYFPSFFASFSVLLSDERLSNFAVAYSFTESHNENRERKRYGIFLVSSDFALFSQPWYIWYSHVHINNVYRNLRAMLTSTFPLRLRIFVLFSVGEIFFPSFHWCRWCAIVRERERFMQVSHQFTYAQTKRLCLCHTHRKRRDTDFKATECRKK